MRVSIHLSLIRTDQLPFRYWIVIETNIDRSTPRCALTSANPTQNVVATKLRPLPALKALPKVALCMVTMEMDMTCPRLWQWRRDIADIRQCIFVFALRLNPLWEGYDGPHRSIGPPQQPANNHLFVKLSHTENQDKIWKPN